MNHAVPLCCSSEAAPAIPYPQVPCIQFHCVSHAHIPPCESCTQFPCTQFHRVSHAHSPPCESCTNFTCTHFHRVSHFEGFWIGCPCQIKRGTDPKRARVGVDVANSTTTRLLDASNMGSNHANNNYTLVTAGLKSATSISLVAGFKERHVDLLGSKTPRVDRLGRCAGRQVSHQSTGLRSRFCSIHKFATHDGDGRVVYRISCRSHLHTLIRNARQTM
jgi:hypothetical protein